MSDEINYTATVRDGQTYLLIWLDGRGSDAYRALHVWANDSRLNFTHWDCALMCLAVKATLDLADNTRTSPGRYRR